MKSASPSARAMFFRPLRIVASTAALGCALLAPCSVSAQGALVGQDYQKVEQLLRSKNLAGATKEADAYLATNPRDPQMRLLKSRILAAQGQKEEAKGMLLTLTQDYPEIAEPFNNLAVAYAEEGQITQAREALEAALRINPAYTTALENLGDIYRCMAFDTYAKALGQQPGNKALQAKMQAIKP